MPNPETGHRPCHRGSDQYRDDPHWRDLVLFYEFFHGDSGHGCGARYVSDLLCDCCEFDYESEFGIQQYVTS